MGQWDSVPVDGHRMRAYVNLAGAAPAPGAVVIHHGWGVDEVIQDVVDRLAERGYAAIAPELFHRQAPEDDVMKRIAALRDREVVADVTAAAARLKARPGGLGRLGIVGFCMGGRVSYLLAGSGALFQAAAVFYGGDISVPWGADAAPLDLTRYISCPVIGFFGNEDTNPSPADVKRITGELTRHGKSHEFHTYDGAGHAFLNFRLPARYRESAAKDAWAKLLAFFDTSLKG